ncbi:MAG: glycosyltransferase family 8 protein [Clostridia bacterium]|nr:glycosyltransferase family 8 protein [Clostridia bacterium]
MEEIKEASNGERINILMCGNEAVFRGIVLTLLSIRRHTSDPITLYIGTMDLTAADERYRPISEEMRALAEALLRERNADSRAVLVDFGRDFLAELSESKNLDSAYTPYAMIRLFAPRIEGIGSRLLYLDTDVLVLGDISELYRTDIDGYHLAAVRDYFGKIFFSPRYFNSGVVLFNMDMMRRDEVFERCIELCRERRMLLFDQHALNKYAKRRKLLPRRYNEQRRTMPDTLLRHFAMTIHFFPKFRTENIKPWQPELVHTKLGDHSFDDIFEEYRELCATALANNK